MNILIKVLETLALAELKFLAEHCAEYASTHPVLHVLAEAFQAQHDEIKNSVEPAEPPPLVEIPEGETVAPEVIS